MPYDATEESIRLIENGLPEVPDRLSRRRRFAPLAVDVDGDIAVTMFARRGVNGDVWTEHWVLCLFPDGWRCLGGGGSGTNDLLADRKDAPLDGRWMWTGNGATIRDGGRLLPRFRHRFICYSSLRVAPDVHLIEVAGRRRIVVPRHGTVCVVWSSQSPPAVALLGVDGQVLERLELARPGGLNSH